MWVTPTNRQIFQSKSAISQQKNRNDSQLEYIGCGVIFLIYLQSIYKRPTILVPASDVEGPTGCFSASCLGDRRGQAMATSQRPLEAITFVEE